MKEKIIQNSKGSTHLNWKSHLLTGLGIVIVSIIKHDGIDSISIGSATVATAAFLYLVSLRFPQGSRKEWNKKIR